MNDEPIDWPEDVTRIQEVLRKRGINLTDHQVDAAWTAYSEELFAGWLCLPGNDDELFGYIEAHLPQA